jgi:hypothetical protein
MRRRQVPRRLICNDRDNQPFRSRRPQQDLHRPNFYPSRRHAQTPETWTLWLYGLGVEILSQRGLDEGGNKLHWRVFLCVARLRGA